MSDFRVTEIYFLRY